MIEHIEPLAVRFADDGMIPNNPRFPVLIYVRAFSPVGSDPAATVEKVLGENRWTPEWRDGIYDFHHYHSTAHETLAIANGTVNVRLGGALRNIESVPLPDSDPSFGADGPLTRLWR